MSKILAQKILSSPQGYTDESREVAEDYLKLLDPWISVDDKLPNPEPTGDCNQVTSPIILAQGSIVGIGYFSYEKKDDKWIPLFAFKDFFVCSDHCITHWMPLPQPPK